MTEKAGFKDKQYAFAKHIRDPDNNPAPSDAEDRRMAIYRELFFNNLKSLLSQTFPVLSKLHQKERWNRLIRLFMVKHQAQSPYFLEIPEEFLSFLQEEYEADEDDFPFLIELAHYEWVELALSVSDAEPSDVRIDSEGDLLSGTPIKSKLAWQFAYRFPVHRISTTFVPKDPGDQPTFLAVCRKANDDMDFMELNAVTARLLELIAENASATTPLSGLEVLRALGAEIEYSELDALIEHGHQAMRDMQQAEILLGTLER